MRREARTCCSCAARSRARAALSWRCAAMADAPVLGADAPRARSSSTTPPSARASTARSCTRACAPSRPRAAAARPRRRRAAWSPAAAPSRGARRAPAAPAPAPPARRSGPAAAPCSAPTRAPTPSRSTARSSRAALRSALSLHAERGSLAILDATGFAGAEDPPGARPARGLEPAAARRSSCSPSEEPSAALSFRNLARVSVLSAEDVGVADLVGAASLLVSEPALDALTARAQPTGSRRAAEKGPRPDGATPRS